MKHLFWFALSGIIAAGCVANRATVMTPSILAWPTDVPGVFAYDPWRQQPEGHALTPPGFCISPELAGHIYYNLLHYGGHWGAARVPQHLYFDTEGYYIFHSGSGPTNISHVKDCLHNAVRISGHDGRVFDTKANAWQVNGYIHRNGDTLCAWAPIGSRLDNVLTSVGKYFEGSFADFEAGKLYALSDGGLKTYLGTMPKTLIRIDSEGREQSVKPNFKTQTVIRYWAKDGEVVMSFEDGKLMAIGTRVPNSRK